MAQQYSNFSNPTITSDQPMGWQAASQNTQQAISSMGSYLADQQSKVQSLQMQQASDLSKARTMAQLYYPQAIPQVESMMSQNPYARRAFPQQQPQGGMAQTATQPMGGNPNMMGSMIGAPGTTPYGTGMLPTPSTTGSGDTSGGGMSMSPVSTGGTITSGGMEPPKFSQSIVNPVGEQVKAQATAQGEANVAPNKEYSTKMASELADSNIGSIRQNSMLQRTASSLQNLVDLHKQLSDKGAAGNAWSEWVADNYNKIPNNGEGGSPIGMRDKSVSPDVQNLIGKYRAARNETMISTQPNLTAQFDKPGSSRIMDSVLDLTKQEYGSLDTPHNEMVGNAQGTLGTLMRFDNATGSYFQDLRKSGLQLPTSLPNPNNDPNIDSQNQKMEANVAQQIASRFPNASLTSQQQKQLDGLINQVTPPTKSGNINPIMNQQTKQPTQGNQVPKFNPTTQKLQQNSRTGEYRVVNL